MHYHERIISKMEVVQPVQPPPKRADAGERNEMMQSKLQRLPFPSFHLWSGVLYTQVTKVKRGQADFIYELSQDVRQHILTHEDNRGMEQKWAQKIICKSPVDKKPSPLASVQATAEELSVMGHCHILGSGQRPLSVLHGSWTSLLSSTVSLPSWWTLLS